MSLTAPAPSVDDNPPPAGREIGAVTQQVGGTFGWASFVDEQEHVPELTHPASITTYHRMRSDSQIESLHLGTVQPIREFRWTIDPNKAPAALAEQVAADMGLPIRGQEDDAIERGPRQFSFDQFLTDALLAPIYGHFYFEIVGQVAAEAWRMAKLSPRHPRTIAEFQTDTVGDLLAIRQNISGAAGWNRLPDPIPASKLVPFVWRPEAGSHVGRSMLRSVFREWLVKDRTIRVAAINIERGGGVPVIEGPQGASDGQLQDLARLARTFKVAEGGGGAIPFGSRLTFSGGHVPDAIGLLQYCDECMARVWALMLVQLGMTQTGNRALGSEFATYAARAQRSVAKWVADQVNRFLDRYTEWNLGPSATYAPLLRFEQARPDAMSVAELVSLIEVGALHVDPELETWLRNEHGLPQAPLAPSTPELGDLTPEEVALVENSRNPPKIPSPPGTQPPTNEEVQDPTIAAGDPASLAAVPLPDRPLRRRPNTHEIRAAVDFRQIDQTHQTVLEGLQQVWRQQVIPGQITAIGEQVTTTQAGTPRQRVTRAAMASLSAPTDGQDILRAHLAQAARDGANAALAEMAAQSAIAGAPSDSEIDAAVADQANAVVAMAANGLSLSAQRKAAALVGGGRTPDQIRGELTGYLNGLKHQWTLDQLQGAVTMAQNVGRVLVFQTVAQDAMRYYASEILDVATCTPCTDVDGTEYQSLADAEQDYAAGGYVNCDGGPRCRGTLVAVYQETGGTSGDPSVLDFGA